MTIGSLPQGTLVHCIQSFQRTTLHRTGPWNTKGGPIDAGRGLDDAGGLRGNQRVVPDEDYRSPAGAELSTPGPAPIAGLVVGITTTVVVAGKPSNQVDRVVVLDLFESAGVAKGHRILGHAGREEKGFAIEVLSGNALGGVPDVFVCFAVASALGRENVGIAIAPVEVTARPVPYDFLRVGNQLVVSAQPPTSVGRWLPVDTSTSVCQGPKEGIARGNHAGGVGHGRPVALEEEGRHGVPLGAGLALDSLVGMRKNRFLAVAAEWPTGVGWREIAGAAAFGPHHIEKVAHFGVVR